MSPQIANSKTQVGAPFIAGQELPRLGAATVFSGRQRVALLAMFVLLVALRIPHAWAHGRFQDEEATVFFAYAWHHPWYQALFRSFAGYWNFGACATTLIIAQLVKHDILSMTYAPYGTMIMALAAQCLPAILILTGRGAWLAERSTVIVALLIFAIAPGIEEVFFNVLHIQFHLALCVALILALDTPHQKSVRIGYGILLFVTPLCGPGALAFLPLFGLRALIDRDRRRWEQLVAFAAGGAVQMLLFYGPSPGRGHLLDPGTIISAMFVRMIAMPLLGFGKANLLGIGIYHSQVVGSSFVGLIVALTILALGSLLLLAIRRRDAAVWLLVSSLAIATASFGFGMLMLEPQAPYDLDAERYTFLPLVLLALALAVMAARRGSRERPICALLLLLMLVTGISRYTRPLPGLRDGPPWPTEAAAWQRDHNHLLAVWPDPWRADLSDQTRPCFPVRTEPGPSNEPRYCENGWFAGFYHPRHKPL